MFLDESFDLLREEDQYPEITGDTACGMQLILEATEAYNKVDMAMIHLEHTAIVNEDANLLEEGKEGFKEKVASIGRTVKAKFLAWLEKLKNAWINIQNKIDNLFIREKRINKIFNQLKAAQKANIDIEEGCNLGIIKQGINVISNLKALANGIGNESSLQSVYSKLSQIKFESQNVEDVPASILAEIHHILTNRASAVKAIDVIKSKVKSFKDDNKELITKAQQACVKASQLVNSVTRECLKVANAAVKATRKANKETKKAEREQAKANKKAGNEEAKNNNKSESGSILDAFMFD